MTAMEISREAKVPYSKTYEVLNSLKQKGWIKSTETRPFKYYPVPPLEAAAAAKRRLEDEYQSWEQRLAEELQPLYEKRELVERPDILILHGQQAVLAKLEEVLKKANREIMIAAPAFARPLIALVESPSKRRKENGNGETYGCGKTRRLAVPQESRGNHRAQVQGAHVRRRSNRRRQRSHAFPWRRKTQLSHMEQPRRLSRVRTRILPVPLGHISNSLKA